MWAIEQLDDYEGVKPEEGEIPMYRRNLTTVYHSDSTTEAWIYWFNGKIEEQPIISSGDVFQFIRALHLHNHPTAQSPTKNQQNLLIRIIRLL